MQPAGIAAFPVLAGAAEIRPERQGRQRGQERQTVAVDGEDIRDSWER